ncbi:hypothetical protein AAVH_37529 [Aphelenchoides avenae]|nr:hypothetical protein AAVH_37529 [Aphelenchus avenae]
MKRRGLVWTYFTQVSDGASSDSAVVGNNGDPIISEAAALVDRTDVPVNELYRDAIERTMRDDDGIDGHPRPSTKVVVYACNRCTYRCSGANTSNPKKHLMNHHPVQYEELKRKEKAKIAEDVDAAVAACKDQSLSAKNRDKLLKKGTRAMKKLTIGIANGRGVDNLQQVPENRRDLEENGFDWTVIPNVHLPETGTFYTTVPERLEHIRCSVDVETHMWWFLQVSSDATRHKAHAEKVGVEAILGANDANVHYVFRRIQQYMEKLDTPQTWRPWYADVYAEIFKNTSNPRSTEEAKVRKLEAYNRECAVLTYFGHIASRVIEYELIFLGGRVVATVWYK